jgi:hypothetical protein
MVQIISPHVGTLSGYSASANQGGSGETHLTALYTWIVLNPGSHIDFETWITFDFQEFFKSN